MFLVKTHILFFLFPEQLSLFQTMDLGLTSLRKYLLCYIWIFFLFPLLETRFVGKLKFFFPASHIHNFLNNHFKYLNILSHLFSFIIFSKSTFYFLSKALQFLFKNHFCELNYFLTWASIALSLNYYSESHI